LSLAELTATSRKSSGWTQVELSIEEHASALERAQLPPEFVTLITYLFKEVLDGRNAWVADGVIRALGRPPRDFTEYVRDTAATGVWNAGAPGTH
jgi:hypothetical protein